MIFITAYSHQLPSATEEPPAGGQHLAAPRSTLQHPAAPCSTPQHLAAPCSTPSTLFDLTPVARRTRLRHLPGKGRGVAVNHPIGIGAEKPQPGDPGGRRIRRQ